MAEMSEMDLNMASSVSVERPMCVSSLARRRFSFSSVFCCELRVNVEQMWSERGEVSMLGNRAGRGMGNPQATKTSRFVLVLDMLSIY